MNLRKIYRKDLNAALARSYQRKFDAAVLAHLYPRWQRWRDWLAWKLRPDFLKHRGRPVRLRWWICWRLMLRLDPQISKLLNEGRALMFANHAAGRSSPDWMRGKQLAMRGRVLEARLLWLAYEGGAQYFDGSSDIELIHIAGGDFVRNPRKAR